MAVAGRMARTYRERPFELVTLLGDICYYGSIEDRYDEVFRRPTHAYTQRLLAAVPRLPR